MQDKFPVIIKIAVTTNNNDNDNNNNNNNNNINTCHFVPYKCNAIILAMTMILHILKQKLSVWCLRY